MLETTTKDNWVRQQFDERAASFERSVYWVTDPGLISAHLRLAGKPPGRVLDLCCGTGAVARGFKAAGWNTMGLDLSEKMVREARRFVPADVGNAAELPYFDATFDVVIMRHAYHLLDQPARVLREIRRVLKPGGRLILSQVVPFSMIDRDHLRKIFQARQPFVRGFHTVDSLVRDLEAIGLTVRAHDQVVVRESVSLWTKESPELSDSARREICDLVVNAPSEYRQLRRVEVVNDEILEDWNFTLILASPKSI